MKAQHIKSIAYGTCASVVLLTIYFGTLSLVSGFGYAQSQFTDFWKYTVSLALGFGIQVGLYTYLKSVIQDMHGEGRVLGVTGTTSTVAMISCCAHYLVNVIPLLGAVGVATLISQYQIELFWVGLSFNFVGIIFITRRIMKLKKS